MFSQTLEYALRVMIHLAYQSEPVTTKQISVATKVPEGYLAKVIQALNKGGLVHSQRGLHGGSTLARPAEAITIFDIVALVDPIKRIETCPLGLKSHGVNLCPLHRRMDAALDMVEKAFRECTLADIMADPNTSKPLCDSVAAKGSSDAVASLTVRHAAR